MLPSESNTVIADTGSMPVMRWGAIIGGWLVATGIASMLYVGGSALGLSAFDPHSAEATAKGIGVGTAGWMILTWTVSLFLGGMFASWFDGRSDQTMGALHGVTVWGLSITASGLLLTLGASQALQGAALAGIPQAQVMQRAAPASDQQNAPGIAAPSAQPAAQAQPVARPDAAQAEAVKRYTATAMCIAFVSALLALIASGIGGWMGAGHIHRVYHLRRYDTRPAVPR